MEIPPTKGPQLEPDELASIESIHENAGMLAGPLKETVTDVARALPSTAASLAKATTAVTRPIANGVECHSRAAGIVRATAHEAIKMKKGILPLIPSKFARAENGVVIPVSLTQYCVQGETRRGRQTRHGIVAADPRIFPLARYVEVFLGDEYLGRYLVDDTGGNVLGATLDILESGLQGSRAIRTTLGQRDPRRARSRADAQRFPGADALGRTREAIAVAKSRGANWPYNCSTAASKTNPRPLMSSFSTYLIGFIVLIIGLAIAAILLGVSQTWVIVGCIVLIGIGILTGTTRTKPKDPQA